MDELSPLFQEIEFSVLFRGYDPDQVDAYVDRVAKAAALVQGRMTELHSRAEAAEARAAEGRGGETEETLRRTLVLAQRTADAAVSEAREEAARLVADAESKAQTTTTMVDARVEAQLRDAEERAGKMIAEAETDRRTMVAEAESAAIASAEEARGRLEAEVAELARTRDFLADDIEILERHLREQRARLVSSVATLSDLLEAPDSLRLEPAPATSGVEAPPVGVGEATQLHETIPPAPEETPPQPAPIVEPEPEPTALVEPEEPESVGTAMAQEELESVDTVMAQEEPEPVDTAMAQEEPFASVAAVEWAPDPVAALADEDAASDEVDLTVDPASESDNAVIDLVAEERITENPQDEAGDAGPEDPVPPRLVTAADLDSDRGGPQTAMASGPATAQVPVLDEPAADANSLFVEVEAVEDDPFLAQLRDAVVADTEPGDEEALTAFFDGDEDDEGRSWFGRRR